MTFGEALESCKGGAEVSRLAWKSAVHISMKAQYPDENSKMTKPYLYMIKGDDKFPLDLSCESMFADDWFIVPVVGATTANAEVVADSSVAGAELNQGQVTAQA